MSQESLPEEFRASGLKRIFNALFYSMEGLGTTLKHEEAFRQEMALAIILIPLAIFLPVGFFAKAILIGSVMIVLIVELLNSAIEATIDYISTANHYLAKRAKDMGSAAVLLSLLQLFAVWSCIILDRWTDVSARFELWFSWITG